jgi:glutamyl-tRNA(Gln) amidotransferase subunit E
VAEAILLIGRVCRSTGHVRTGIGASRQDVNVSVRGGCRVEIKGVPQAGWARALVHGEAIRQVNLLKLREELHALGYRSAEDLRFEHRDVTSLCSQSGFSQLTSAGWTNIVEQDKRRPGFELGEGAFSVRAVRLPGLAGFLNKPTQPDHTFAHELKGRIRVIAGLDQQPILMYSDKWPDYEGSYQELRRLRHLLKCGDNDGLALVWGCEGDTITAIEEIRLRFADAIAGVPNETRQPYADGHTDFERILPGPDRMYPDTDSPPTSITTERVAQLKTGLPEAPWAREVRYAAADVPRPVIHFLIRKGGADLVDAVVQQAGASLKRVCFFFGEELRCLRRGGVDVDGISLERWVEFFRETQTGPARWDARRLIVTQMAQRPAASVAQCVAALGLERVPRYWEDRALLLAESGYAPGRGDSRERRLRYGLGQALRELRGRVPVGEVCSALVDKLKDTVDRDAGWV